MLDSINLENLQEVIPEQIIQSEDEIEESRDIHLGQTADSYYKDSLYAHSIAVLYETLVPIAFFNELDKYYYRAHYNEERSMVYSDNQPRDPYWNSELEAWWYVSVMHLALFAPTLLLAMVGMSDILGNFTASYILNVFSNFYIPLYIYSIYLIFEGSVNTGSGLMSNIRLYGYIANAITMMTFHFANGTETAYYMNQATSPYADISLYPAFFYWINWIDHTVRT